MKHTPPPNDSPPSTDISSNTDIEPNTYIGRFAPSPTGPLHFGSLLGALASYLDARHHQGKWLLRMEDLDPPREQPGAAAHILQTLDDHQLHWDDEVLYQSQRHEAYRDQLNSFQQQQLAYPCQCSRQTIQSMGGIYDGRCRNAVLAETQASASRIKIDKAPDTISFDDIFQGAQTQQLSTEVGDFIIQRKDGLFAYQLAVVVDDIFQGITHVIRGCDLLDSSARQLYLFQLCHAPAPHFGHIPLALNRQGQKLSKQNLAPALDAKQAGKNIWQALHCLNQKPPEELQSYPAAELLLWATQHWQRQAVPATHTLPAELTPS